MIIIHILVALVEAILKVFADAFLAGGIALTEALIALLLATAAIWTVTIVAISFFRRGRSNRGA